MLVNYAALVALGIALATGLAGAAWGARRKVRAVAVRARRDEDGSILVMTAMVLPIVIGFVGLMLDGAMILADRRELQDAADSAGLAGAMQVDLEEFSRTGHWRISDTVQIAGEMTAHQAAQEVCLAYGVTCETDVPSEHGRRTFVVIARTETRTAFMQLFTGDPTIDLVATSTAAMAPGF
jgi:uncharacterized membrane protein